MIDENGFYDFSYIREKIGLLARFWKGGLSIPMQIEMDWFEILKWYDVYELQSTEEEVVNELCYDKKTGEKKKVSYSVIREETLKRIEDRKK